MDILDYFESLRRGIQQNHSIGSIEEPVLMQAFDDCRGLFRARVFFWDNSHLTIDEVIDTEGGYPEILRYSYNYIKGNEHVLRYDNAPHYPALENFPHHKHIGPDETPESSHQPRLSQVFSEIEAILATGSGGS
ncbi:MAG: hypothetical protein HY872_09060 [Chloroflexi bacterium]|nr:hypothetical protein [Chloroflexota bacterium]MBI5828294.1 hypothetical protein [Chloroflexota bacterium]